MLPPHSLASPHQVYPRSKACKLINICSVFLQLRAPAIGKRCKWQLSQLWTAASIFEETVVCSPSFYTKGKCLLGRLKLPQLSRELATYPSIHTTVPAKSFTGANLAIHGTSQRVGICGSATSDTTKALLSRRTALYRQSFESGYPRRCRRGTVQAVPAITEVIFCSST